MAETQGLLPSSRSQDRVSSFLVPWWVDSTNASFLNGTWIGPQLVRSYNNESLTVQFPPGQTVSGFGAICIWCEVINMCFTRATFPRAPADLDIDGDADLTDMALLSGCALGPDTPRPNTRICIDADFNIDGRVDLLDVADGEVCFSGGNQRPVSHCIE